MKAHIIGFHQDELDDWVAELSCGHSQHMRHQPPFFNRPWVIDSLERANKLGHILDCKQCDADQSDDSQ